MKQEFAEHPPAFENAAESYDADFDGSWVTRRLRDRIYRRFLDRFPPDAHLLELNCGTGTDALHMAQRGVRVTAFDAAPSMIDQARSKLARNGLSRLVTFETISFGQMTRFPSGAFDGAYSNFGGLNCAEDIAGALAETARVLKPGSRFVVCILNRVCVWEIASFLLRGQFSAATRRLHRTPVSARVGTASIPTWYYTPGEFAQRASANFALVRVCGLSVVSPPPGASSFIGRHPSIVKLLLGVEERICGLFPFNGLGDHTILELVRQGS